MQCGLADGQARIPVRCTCE